MSEPIGDVRAVWDRDPEVDPGHAREQGHTLRAEYVQVGGMANVVWLEHRRRIPIYNGPLRLDDHGYVEGTTVYDAPTGDFWTATRDTMPGESPSNHPDAWEVLAVPYLFAEYLALSIYAALTNKDQSVPEDFGVQLTAGWPLLRQELDKIERQQGQTRQLRVINTG
jgi:hypothetical protein